jgi:hypothetical protein
LAIALVVGYSRGVVRTGFTAGGVLAAALAVAGAMLAVPPTAAAQAGAPLPDRDAFLEEVRARLRSDQAILRQYMYKRHVVERDRDGDGRVTETRSRTYEMRPLPDDPDGVRWIVARDGEPRPPAELAREEAEYERRLALALQPETERQRRRRLAREAERRRDDEAAVADVTRLFAVELVGREHVAGMPAIVVTFTPRPEVEPATRAGRFLKNVSGRAWFSETEFELLRVESEVFETFTYGWGILARIHKGAQAVIERQRLPDGTYLPKQYAFSGRGRVLLVRGVQRDVTITLSDFRKAPPQAVGRGTE